MENQQLPFIYCREKLTFVNATGTTNASTLKVVKGSLCRTFLLTKPAIKPIEIFEEFFTFSHFLILSFFTFSLDRNENTSIVVGARSRTVNFQLLQLKSNASALFEILAQNDNDIQPSPKKDSCKSHKTSMHNPNWYLISNNTVTSNNKVCKQ